MRIKTVKAQVLLALLAALIIFVCGLPIGEHPAWANFKVVVKDDDGDEVDDSPYYCLSVTPKGLIFHCAQPEGHVEEIETESGWKVQIWTLPKPMP